MMMAAMLTLLGSGVAVAQTAAPQAAPAAAAVGRKVAVEGGAYTVVTPAELQKMMAAKDFTLINVHVPSEGDLPDTDVSIAFNEIDAHLEMLPSENSAKIVLYCKTGPMSTRAASTLVKLGFTNLHILEGGFNAWTAAGNALAAAAPQ
jgi:phage shock protein E